MLPPSSINRVIEQTVREEWGRILAALVKSIGDLQLAEDCLQEAAAKAVQAWPKSGLPDAPAAWLLSVARRKAIDVFRNTALHSRTQAELSYLAELEQLSAEEPEMQQIPDKRLEMIFTCCHPALEEKSQVALTLRSLGGLTTEEIAGAFLDRKTAMAQRLVRAKKKIQLAGVPFAIPDRDDLPDRLGAVLKVLYLIFNEGYSASRGPSAMRADLSNEAIRLCRIVSHLMPDECEVSGLLALMLLHDSRRYARSRADGGIVALQDQNRARWDKPKMAEGIAILKRILPLGRAGPYQVQAAISAVHAQASSWQDTDWDDIAGLYGALYALQPSSVVHVNRAVAVSYARSAAEGLALLRELDDEEDLSAYQPFHAAMGDLLARDGQTSAALISLRKAVSLSANEAEAGFLEQKIADLSRRQ